MPTPANRRSFLTATAGAGALAVVGDLSFLRALQPVAAAD